MNTGGLVALLGATLIVPPPAAFADEATTAAEVLAADAAWAKHVGDVGPARSVPDGMDAADGLFFDTGPPLRGAAAISAMAVKNYPPGSKLAWTPVNAFGSKSGTADGQWKALTDMGNPDPN